MRLLTTLCLIGLLGSGATVAPLAAQDLIAPLSDGSTLELPQLDSSLPAPPEILGYSLGDRFSHQGELLGYLSRLAEASDRVTLWEYGRTYEGRPLTLLAVGSPDRIADLETQRSQRQRLGDPGPLEATELRELEANAPVVVWLAYGVHGNEASSTEAAMATAYVLAAADGEWTERLDEVLVLIDPLSNPDGRERYIHFYESRRGRLPDPLAAAAEHREPWPGGRQNHYLIDLNRDWSWATQQETRARLAAYREWEPQVYVDMHEMYPDSTYFFPPSAEPLHPHINARTPKWLQTFGRSNAAAFDRQGWLYYAGEVFDLFYPGYGDSYPSLRGGVGMTYEVAGSGRAGEALELSDGRLLTLSDRIARHLTTSLATVATAAENRGELLADFVASRQEAVSGPVLTYLWEGGQQEAGAAAEQLRRHGIRVEQLAGETRLEAREIRGGEEETRTFAPGTWVASTAQPLGALIRALMELNAPMAQGFLERQRQRIEDNRPAEFYDITAWSIPVAFNLETWMVEGPVGPTRFPGADTGTGVTGEGDLGFLVPPQGLAGYRLVAGLQRAELRYRLALSPVSNGSGSFPAGSLFVPRQGNPADVEEVLDRLARESGVRISRVATGYSDGGVSLGSNSVVPVRHPTIGLLSGPGISVTSFGAVWHLLDQQLGLPHHRLDIAHLEEIDLSRFDTLILPDGRGYGSRISEEGQQRLERWISEGGVLVAIRGAVTWLQKVELSTLKSWEPPQEELSPDDNGAVPLIPSRRALFTPGAALATRTARDHPLTAGLPSPPPALFVGSQVLLPTGDPRRDVLVAVEEDPVIAGFAWPEAKQRLQGALLVGTESKGKGAIVAFAQDPIFRLFWRGTAPLFLNSAIYGPSLMETSKLY